MKSVRCGKQKPVINMKAESASAIEEIDLWQLYRLGVSRDSVNQKVMAVLHRWLVSRSEDCTRLVDETIKSFGGIDILINNAGTSATGEFESVTDEEWQA